jgi:predicted HTH domain antitoxin
MSTRTREFVKVNISITKDLLGEIDKIAHARYADRSTTIRQLLNNAIKREKIEKAVNEYREGKVTLRKGAEIAGVDYFQFQSILAEKDIPVTFSLPLAKKRVERLLRE